MGDLPEFFPLAKYWPFHDTSSTLFRYAIAAHAARSAGKVLEIGGAALEGTRLLTAVCPGRVTALDKSPLAAGQGDGLPANLDFVQMDAMDVGQAFSGQFDLAIAYELIEHLADPRGFQHSVFDALGEGGALLMTTPNFDLVSDRGDGDRKPIFEHHQFEYRPDEFRRDLLDCWQGARIVGFNPLNLAVVDPATGHANVLMACDDLLFDLELGPKYPQYSLRLCGRLPRPLPLEFATFFLAVLGKGRPFALDLASLAPAAGPQVSMSMEEAAFRSAHVMLQRRNKHVLDLMLMLQINRHPLLTFPGRVKRYLARRLGRNRTG